MKTTCLILSSIVLMLPAAGCSTVQPDTGIVNDRLHPCPASPNCVCSEFADHASYIAPVSFRGPAETAWEKAVTTIENMGGTIISQEREYLHATFTSRIFRFIDDVELRMDTENAVIHVRSASRKGYSDLGVNKRRAERFRNIFSTSP